MKSISRPLKKGSRCFMSYISTWKESLLFGESLNYAKIKGSNNLLVKATSVETNKKNRFIMQSHTETHTQKPHN